MDSEEIAVSKMSSDDASSNDQLASKSVDRMKKIEAAQAKPSTFKKEREDFKSVEPESTGKHDFGIKSKISGGDSTTKNKQKQDFDILLGG